MKLRNLSNDYGFTLLELILVLFLCSLLTSYYVGMVSHSINYWQESIERIRVYENLQYSLHFIEKNIRQFDQQKMEYCPDILQIKSENSQGQISYMDFSGNMIYHFNTYMYYHAGNRQLRINRNTEHNVLALDIHGVSVREVIPGTLLEISLSSRDKYGKEHTLTTKIRINHRR